MTCPGWREADKRGCPRVTTHHLLKCHLLLRAWMVGRGAGRMGFGVGSRLCRWPVGEIKRFFHEEI